MFCCCCFKGSSCLRYQFFNASKRERELFLKNQASLGRTESHPSGIQARTLLLWGWQRYTCRAGKAVGRHCLTVRALNTVNGRYPDREKTKESLYLHTLKQRKCYFSDTQTELNYYSPVLCEDGRSAKRQLCTHVQGWIRAPRIKKLNSMDPIHEP